MKNKSLSNKKKLVLASVVAVLSACGGNYDGGSSDSSNTPPMLDLSVKPAPEAALVNANTVTGCEYVDTEDPNIQQLNCTFQESDIFNTAAGVDTSFDVDLRSGILDADLGDSLSITNLKFLWEGVNCYQIRFNTILLEDNPQCGTEDTIAELILALPVEDRAEYDGMTAEQSLERYRLRLSQELPRFSDRDYAFNQQRFSYLVTPSMMAPLLREGQYTSLHMQYEVTDGLESITRRLLIRINGESSAPVDNNPAVGEEGYAVGFAFGSDTNQEVDLLAGFADPDIQRDEVFEEQVASLDLIYNAYTDDYVPQQLRVTGFRLLSGTEDGVGYVVNQGSGMLTIVPSDFADILSFGEERLLRFEYDVHDGDPVADLAQSTTRIFEYLIVGTDDTNPPFFFDQLVSAFGSGANELPWGSEQTFSLFDGARDPDGDTISVASLDDDGAGALYGVDISEAMISGDITIDSVPFYIVPEGETRDLVFTYTLTDGVLESAERTLTVRLKGYARNILKNAGVDVGFENGDLYVGDTPAGQWAYGWSADGAATNIVDVGGVDRPVQAVLDNSSGLMPNSGDHFLYTSPGWSTAAMSPTSPPVGMLRSGARYYVNYWAKSSSVWSTLNVGISSTNDWNGRELTISSPINGTSEWREHTGYFEGDGAFSALTPTWLWFQSEANNEVLYDDLSIVRYAYDPVRDFAGPQLFEGDSLGNWDVLNAAGGNVNITADAGFNATSGLEVDTTDQTDTVIVQLPASAIPDGAIQQGGRYRVEFDMRFVTHPEDGNGASNATVTAAFYDEASPATRMAINNFLVNASWTHFDYTFNVDVLNTGDVDWANTDVGFQIEFNKPGETFYIDNVRIYQMP